MSKRRKRNKKMNSDQIDLITFPPAVVPSFTSYEPEPEYPKFRYLTHYDIVKEYKGFNYKETGKHIIRSKDRTLQYKKSKDGDWYDIPEESSASGPNDHNRDPFFSWF